MKFAGDHKMTAAITASHRHIGELSQAPHDQEMRRLNDVAAVEQLAVMRWGKVAQTIIEMRNDLRTVADDRSVHPARHIPEAIDLMARAASSLGPHIAEAVRHQREHERLLNEARSAIVDADNVHRAANPLPGMTNIEMDQLLRRHSQQRAELVAKDGCCGGTPSDRGICFGYGPCPRLKEIKSCVSFCERLIAWADDLQPASLSNDNPFLSQENPE